MSALAIVTVALLAFLATLYDGIHIVPEGHVGAYWRGGRLLDTITYPGIHTKIPFIDRSADVQVTMQTDSVTDIPCGTSGGVMVYFDRIEVVNRLEAKYVLKTMREYGVNYDRMWIFDKIHHEINQFCSSHSLREVYIEQFDTLDESLQKALQASCDKFGTGIEIITVRVTKPRIPESVRRNYELIEAERASLLLAAEQQKVVQKQAETDAEKQRIQAQTAKTVRMIEIEKEISEREGIQKMNKINDEIMLHAEKAKADAALYSAQKEAEANLLRLTPAFLEYTKYQALANNTKIYFGNLPELFYFGDGAATANGAIPSTSTSSAKQKGN
jgi:regulator of protease activity HflC (stomatin/prohibitin superfamily)